MSLFQCAECGCCENTAVSNWFLRMCESKAPICSACDPDIGEWHGEFKRVFLPKGMFKTNKQGNLEHIETGETDFSKYEIQPAMYESDITHRPKGSMCIVCSNFDKKDCSQLDFTKMKQIGKDDDGVIVVRCTDFTKYKIEQGGSE